MKVVHVTSVHTPFDVRIFRKMCRSCADAGWDVVLVAPHSASGTFDGLTVKAVPVRKSRLARALLTSCQAVRAALRERPDIMHFHDPELMPWAWLLAMRGRKVIFDMHENLPAAILSKTWIPRAVRRVLSSIWYRLEKLMLGRVAVIFAENSYRARYPGLTRHETILNMPIVDALTGICARKHAEWSVGYVGSVAPQRGSIITLEALALLQRAGLRLRYECIGAASASHMDELRATVNRLGLDNVVFAGALPAKEAWTRLARCHVGLAVLQPVPNYLESYPTKLFEYMALGLPVVVSDFPLYRTIVEGAKAGICVDSTDPRAIAQALRWIAEHAAEGAQMGRNGLEAVRRSYGWAQEEKKLLAFYRTVFAGTASSTAVRP